jgi:hypothetical protein
LLGVQEVVSSNLTVPTILTTLITLAKVKIRPVVKAGLFLLATHF